MVWGTRKAIVVALQATWKLAFSAEETLSTTMSGSTNCGACSANIDR